MSDWTQGSHYTSLQMKKDDRIKANWIVLGVLMLMAIVVSVLGTLYTVEKQGDAECKCIDKNAYAWLWVSGIAIVLFLGVVATLIMYPHLFIGPHKLWFVSFIGLLIASSLVGWGLFTRQFGDEGCTCTKKEVVAWSFIGSVILFTFGLFIVLGLTTDLLVR